MLVCRDESIAFSPEERGTIGSQVQAWVSAWRAFARGRARGCRCHHQCPRAGGARSSSTKGPRVEMTAPASGFNLLERADLDEAIEVSAKHPIARYGVIELRPIAEG